MPRAKDLPDYARAFLDAVAVGESGGASDDAAHSVLFGGSHFLWDGNALTIVPVGTPIGPATAWPPTFPNWAGVWINGLPTHAAGRYQFEPRTYAGLGGGPFDPVSQDHRAWALAVQAMPSLPTGLQSGNPAALSGIASTLKSQWSSLDPATFPTRYTTALGALGSE
jgi:hypothetical protein